MNTPPPPSAPARAQLALTPAVFLALSSGLTGVSPGHLRATAPPHDFADRFYSALCENVPAEILHQLAQTFLSADSVTDGSAEVLVNPRLGPVARSLVRLWLTGSWHDPLHPAAPPRVVCDLAYRQSPVWRILKAHPLNEPGLDLGLRA